jgi:glycosyltransferase involved in cell wall biosynthesis
MRVGLVASPFITVPPARYGGTELFVANLAEALVRTGVDVSIYTNGESSVNADVRWRYPNQDWPLASANSGLMKELDHASWAIEMASEECDIIHINSTMAVPFSRFTSKPVVCTLHHPCEQPLTDIYERYDSISYVAISRHQASVHPSVPSTVIHHGLDLARYQFSEEKLPYLCFLGRICPIKGTHYAIDIAKRAGSRLKIAGEVQPIFQDYFDEMIRPHIDGRQIQFLGEADHAMKNDLLKHATALLFPIEWEEPFGLVMIEAMACGTPVIAFRGGAVEEVVMDGISGYVCRNADEAVAALACNSFSPRIVRAYVERHFSSDVMARRYRELYRRQTRDTELIEEMGDLGDLMEAS